MKYLLYSLLSVTLFTACKKDNAAGKTGSKVDIYMLKSFTIDVDQAVNPSTLSISNAVLADSPLVADKDIAFYLPSSSTFGLAKDLKSTIKDYDADQAFAVTVDKAPVYFGIFHPSYLNSIFFGLATIDPTTYTTANELSIQYATIAGNVSLLQFDKRNDTKIINALRMTGRVK